jgi:hypothetical protein
MNKKTESDMFGGRKLTKENKKREEKESIATHFSCHFVS